jgi:hypothetical protein
MENVNTTRLREQRICVEHPKPAALQSLSRLSFGVAPSLSVLAQAVLSSA